MSRGQLLSVTKRPLVSVGTPPAVQWTGAWESGHTSSGSDQSQLPLARRTWTLGSGVKVTRDWKENEAGRKSQTRGGHSSSSGLPAPFLVPVWLQLKPWACSDLAPGMSYMG